MSHVAYKHRVFVQLLLKSKTLHFADRSIIAGSKETATGLMVITSGQVALGYSNLPLVSFWFPDRL